MAASSTFERGPLPPISAAAPSEADSEQIFAMGVTESDVLTSVSMRPGGARQPLPPVRTVCSQSGGGYFFTQRSSAKAGTAAGTRKPYSGVTGGAEFSPAVGNPAAPPPLPEALSSPLQWATWIQCCFVSSLRTVPGIISGGTALEIAMLSAARGPLSPFLLYGTNALHFQRLYLWGSLACLTGSLLLIRRRWRSVGFYASFPRARWSNYVSVALWTIIALIAIGLREATYKLGDREAVAALPYLVPQSSFEYLTRIGNSPYAQPMPAIVVVRAILVWTALVLSFLPSADDTPPALRADTNADAAPIVTHILDRPAYASTLAARGATYTLAFWGDRQIEQATMWAPDGSPALQPIPRFAMDRAVFAKRVLVVAASLAADAAVNALSESVRWYDSRLGNAFGDFDSSPISRIFPQLVLAGVMLIERTLIMWNIFYMLTETGMWRLGLLRTVSRQFRHIFPIQLSSVLLPIALGVTRTVCITQIPQQPLHPGSALGQLYTTLLVFHLIFTVVFYVSTIDAMRLLARSELYVHPDRDRPGVQA